MVIVSDKYAVNVFLRAILILERAQCDSETNHFLNFHDSFI